MNQGGIFAGPTALGLVSSGSGVSCLPDNSALVRKVQAYLRDNGAPMLKIDGVWQGCTASAFRKVFGRPYVTVDDIQKMTGETCKSADTLPFGIVPGFTISSINVCNDGSDGVPAGTTGGGATPAQQCAAGSCWSDLARTCVPDPFGLMCPKNGAAPTPQQQGCPQGQAWNDFLKMCLPSLTTPVTSPPSVCPQGTIPANGKCVGVTGITEPTECPQGQTNVGGQCVPGSGDFLSTIGQTIGQIFGQQPAGTQPGTQPAGTPPAGLEQIIGGITGAIANIFGAGGSCAPGLVFNPATGQCVGPGGVSVPPGWTAPTTPGAQPAESPWGTAGYVIAGVVGIGAMAALGVWAFKGKGTGELTEDEDLILLNQIAMEMGESPEGLGYDEYGYQPNRRRRRGRKSKRRGRSRRRGRRAARRSRRSRRRRWSRR